jgi:hypothetical protein
MRTLRSLLVAVSAAAAGAALVFSAAGSPSPAPAGHRVTVHAHLTARFLAEARAALARDLRTPDTAVFLHGRPTPGRARASTLTSDVNWAGYADVASNSGAFTNVSGSWTVPAVTCTAEDRITSEWVGLDGFSDSTVEQAGTVGQCFKGTALYYTWYEMYPAGTVQVGTTVTAGDSITASVTRLGVSYTLKLTDAAHTGSSFSKTLFCPTTTCLDKSAEWIAERPAYSNTGIVPEAQFSTVTFSNASETGWGITSTISGWFRTNYDLTCVDSTGTYDIVSTSGLTGGNAFTSTWRNSY